MRTLLATLLTTGVVAMATAEIQIDVDLSAAGPTSIGVYDGDGRLVRTLSDAQQLSAGAQTVAWDLRDDDGQPVAPGSYEWRAANGSAIKPVYVATVANGRHPQVPSDLGNVEGMALFDIKVDHDGTIYSSGSGHGKSVQKISPNGIVDKAATNVSAVEVVSAIALDGQFIYAIGDNGFYRIDKKSMKIAPWPNGDVVVRFEQPPKWYPAGDKWDQYEVLRKEGIESLRPGEGNDPRIHGWRGIMRHPQWYYEGERSGGADVWGDRLLISDSHYNQIHVYDTATGDHLESWDGFTRPNGIAVQSETEALVVADGKVKAIDPKGNVLRDVITDHLTHPAALALGPGGRVFVTDLGIPNQVKVFTPRGDLLKTFGQDGPINGAVSYDKLWIPRGIAVDHRGRIILSEFGLNRIQQLSAAFKSIWDLQAFYCYLGAHDQSDPQWLYGFEGPMFPLIKQFHLDYDTGKWELTRAWYMHWFDDAGSFYGYPSQGGGAVTLDGQKFVYVYHKTLRIYRLDGDQLIPVARIGPRISFNRADGSRADYMRGTAPAWSIWHDLNHDRQVTEDEVSILPNEEASERGYDIYAIDAEIDDSGTAYLGNMAFTLQGVEDGIPRYSWDAANAINLTTPQRPVTHRAITGIGLDDTGNRYFGIKDHRTGKGEFNGLTFWAKRAGWQHIVKHDPDGRRLWRVGRKAYGKVQPGEFSYITSTDWADGLVYVGDMDGYVHVFTDDGLFLTRMFNGTREGAKQGTDPYAITSHELGHVDTFHNDQDGETYIVSQSLEGGEHIRVYRVTGTDRVARTAGYFSISDADLAGVQPATEDQPETAADKGLQVVEITSVLEPPPIDGTLNAWTQLVSPFELATADRSTVVRVIMRYDEKYLYIGAQCQGDDSPARNAYDSKQITQAWKGDCLNLFINSDPEVDRNRTEHLPNDFHLLMPLNGEQAGETLRPYAFKQKQFIEEAEYRLTIDDIDGWTVTARIPWQALGDYLPVPNDKLHIDVQVDFSTPDGSAYLYSVSLGEKFRSFTNPSLWNAEGTIIYAR